MYIQTSENGRAPKRRKENPEGLSRSIGNVDILVKKRKGKEGSGFEAPHRYSKMEGKSHSNFLEIRKN